MELRMDTHSILGMIHAEEALLVAIVRSLPPDIRSKVADDFHEHVEIAETSHLIDSRSRNARRGQGSCQKAADRACLAVLTKNRRNRGATCWVSPRRQSS